MELDTAQFGVVDVKEKQIFNFPKGIPGFEEYTQFAVIDLPDGPFSYLQSVQESQIALLITDPFIFFPDYEFELSDHAIEELELGTLLMIRCILTLNKEVSKSTINLLAPVVFNLETQRAKQVILHSTEYSSRHFLWSKEEPSLADKAGE
ncbi:flagellar assembly protein FliW [Paenibacillus sp. D2_2]|uniref:flagellar assembly protein FliW n=1 Tax=Paenibacillus sp. D2_2 TaxID=3073092 RepID=UPI002816487E|nr:flagellar assembly protein FliW [Paenibacillus sp. D2_2]WMT40664.1 flagellar assembly protein FliW [Paenibacillus sp. D2_2]